MPDCCAAPTSSGARRDRRRRPGVALAGAAVAVVEGETTNIKITDPVDLEIAEVSALPARADEGMTVPAVRVGQGFDVHRFSDDPSATVSCSVDASSPT